MRPYESTPIFIFENKQIRRSFFAFFPTPHAPPLWDLWVSLLLIEGVALLSFLHLCFSFPLSLPSQSLLDRLKLHLQDKPASYTALKIQTSNIHSSL